MNGFQTPPRRVPPEQARAHEVRQEFNAMLTECLRLFRSVSLYCHPEPGDLPKTSERHRRTLAAVRAALKAANDETLTPEDHALLTLLVNGAEVRF